MRLCIIGNSHLAALKLAWETVRVRWPSCDVQFFGVRGRSLLDTRVDDGRLFSDCTKVREHFSFTSNGSYEIVLNDYDMFAIVGAGLGITELMQLYHFCRSDEHARSDQYLVSKVVFRSAALGLLEQTPAAHVWRQLKHAQRRDVCIVPLPAPSDAILDDCVQGEIWCEAEAAGDLARLTETVNLYLAQLAIEGAKLLLQPAESLWRGHFTHRVFSAGSVRLTARLDEQHQTDDYFHMNAAYGSLLLEGLLRSLHAVKSDDSHVEVRRPA